MFGCDFLQKFSQNFNIFKSRGGCIPYSDIITSLSLSILRHNWIEISIRAIILSGADCSVPVQNCTVNGCNNHGSCINGICDCEFGWAPPFCFQAVCDQLNNCSNSGMSLLMDMLFLLINNCLHAVVIKSFESQLTVTPGMTTICFHKIRKFQQICLKLRIATLYCHIS